MTFGEKFKEQRLKLGLTQKELAAKLNLNYRMISMYETGRSFPRSRENYKKMAEVFGVNVNYLLTEDEDFVAQAGEKYGARGMKQAQELLDDMSGLFAGGTLSEQDKDAVMRAMQDIYWESKERNVEKYTPKKYRKQK
ncbi:helix-turn-helix domain-containing protein [Eubacteriales bacterium SGI.150]